MAKADRSNEQISAAAASAWQAQQDAAHLRRRLAKAELKINALEKILIERINVPAEALQEAQKEVEKEISAPRKAQECPDCGRPLQEHSRSCIYCGYQP